MNRPTEFVADLQLEIECLVGESFVDGWSRSMCHEVLIALDSITNDLGIAGGLSLFVREGDFVNWHPCEG